MEKDILIASWRNKEIWYSQENHLPYVTMTNNFQEDIFINDDYSHHYYYKHDLGSDVIKSVAKCGSYIVILTDIMIVLRSSDRFKVDTLYTNLKLIEEIDDE